MHLMSFPNVLITAHQAFFTHEAMTEIAQLTGDTHTFRLYSARRTNFCRNIRYRSSRRRDRQVNSRLDNHHCSTDSHLDIRTRLHLCFALSHVQKLCSFGSTPVPSGSNDSLLDRGKLLETTSNHARTEVIC